MQEYIDSLASLVGDDPRLQAAALIVASLILATLVDFFVSRVLVQWAKRSQTDVDDRFIALIHRPIYLSMLFFGLWLGTSRFGLPPMVELLIFRLIKSLALLIWLLFLMRTASLIVEVMGRFRDRSRLIDPRTISLAANLAKILVVGGGVYFFFLIWGIDVGALLVTGGVVGVAIGFAAKDTLANLFGGIFILADAPYKVGDFIVLGSGERGEVTQVGLRSTRILTRDDVEVTVPNALIANDTLVNESGGPWIKQRVRVKVGVAYGSDIDQVSEVLREVAESHPDIEQDPAPRVRFRAFGDSALAFELLAWIRE
ncbi:MAG: mechanosensitive ion channel family protein, partial [Thermoanaerobaculia bacterium]